ncbi:MAG: protein-methionine-sulfoxide reductase heme-binding subunit MsrQ [Lysobacteraceae bacterium]
MIATKFAAHVLALLPLAFVLWDVWGVWRGSAPHALGADPVAQLTHRTGTWALRLLLVTLAMTPLRRLSGRVEFIRFRRLFGLYTFFYASLHFAIYLGLDLRGYWSTIWADILKRPFITVGFSAWLLLALLASTSTRGWMRRLGRRWSQLHKLVYAIGVLAVLHYAWLVKSDLRIPLIYAGILALLLGMRAWWAWRARKQRKPISRPDVARTPAAG